MHTENDTSKPEDSPQQEAGEGCQERLVSRSFVAEQFARFRASRERQHQIESRRGGSFGIAVHNDADAVEWRTHCREVEESQSFLENRQPIPECWGESSSANSKAQERDSVS